MKTRGGREAFLKVGLRTERNRKVSSGREFCIKREIIIS